MSELVRALIGVCRAFGVFERDAVCCGQVTVPQCLALQELLDGPRDIATLAESSSVTSSAMTRLVDGLEKNGWVERRRGADDRRRIEVVLTRSGKKLATELRGLTERTIARVFDQIPRAKRGQVQESLSLLYEALLSSKDAVIACCPPRDASTHGEPRGPLT